MIIIDSNIAISPIFFHSWTPWIKKRKKE